MMGLGKPFVSVSPAEIQAPRRLHEMGQLVPELLYSCDGTELWRKAGFQLVADLKDFFSVNCVVLTSEDEMFDGFFFFSAVAHFRGDFLYSV